MEEGPGDKKLDAEKKAGNAPTPPPPIPMLFGQKKGITKAAITEDPIKLVRREINALNRILADTATLILNSEDQKKYNPDSGFCRTNGREIELSNLKHLVFWVQGADHLHTISSERMKRLIKACNENRMASETLEMSIASLTQSLDQNKTTLADAKKELANLKVLKDNLVATHKELLSTMKNVRENNLNSGLSHGPKEGKTEYPDLQNLFDNFVLDSKVGILNEHRIKGEDIAQQFFNYLMSAAHQMLGGIKVVDNDVAIKAKNFIDQLGGPDIFQSMSYFGNINDPKSKYGLVKDKDFKNLLNKADEALKEMKESKKMRHGKT